MIVTNRIRRIKKTFYTDLKLFADFSERFSGDPMVAPTFRNFVMEGGAASVNKSDSKIRNY